MKDFLNVLRGYYDFGPLQDRTVLVFDVETTGLNPETSTIVEMGVVVSTNGKVTNATVRRFNPGFPIPEVVSGIHGICDEDVQNCPFADAETVFSEPEWHDPDVIKAAYNASFDIGFLRKYSPLGRLACFDTVLDPFVWVKDADKYQKGKKLTDACSRRGIVLPMPAHSALTDALLTTNLIWTLASNGQVMENWEEWQEKTKNRQDKEYQAWKLKNQRQ